MWKSFFKEMNMKTLIRIFLIVSIIVVVASCNKNTSTQDFPEISIPLNKMNTKVSINLIKNLNSYKIGEDVDFEVMNLTNNRIQIIPDNDIFLYQKNQSTFIKIDNNLHYSSAIDQIPTKQEDIFGTGSLLFIANPKIQEADKSINIRIFVIGTICNGDGTPTNEKVGAYVDAVLHP
jgi:hypothetical protein